MKISYDKTVDAQYIKIKNNVIFRTVPRTEWLIIDENRKGEVVGIEILDASKHQYSVSTADGKVVAIQIHDDESLKIHNIQVDEETPAVEDGVLYPNASLVAA